MVFSDCFQISPGPLVSLRQLFQLLQFRPCCFHAGGAAADGLTHPQLFISSFNGCRASPPPSACRCASSKPAESASSPLSSLRAAGVPVSSTLPLLAAAVAGAAPRCCLRMVRRFLLRRDWLQCRVRLRCHWSREFWASTLSCRAASRGWKLLM